MGSDTLIYELKIKDFKKDTVFTTELYIPRNSFQVRKIKETNEGSYSITIEPLKTDSKKNFRYDVVNVTDFRGEIIKEDVLHLYTGKLISNSNSASFVYINDEESESVFCETVYPLFKYPYDEEFVTKCRATLKEICHKKGYKTVIDVDYEEEQNYIFRIKAKCYGECRK